MCTQLRLAETGLGPDPPERKLLRKSWSGVSITRKKKGQKSKLSVIISCLLALKSTRGLPNTEQGWKSLDHDNRRHSDVNKI